MVVAAETELHGTAARDRLHATVATALREIGDHAAAARTLAGSDELAARAAIAAIRACSTDALGSVRALVALLPAASGRTLADDVHDTLGHALSLASLLAGGAAARLANDPALAREALGQLSTLSAETVAELERLLGPRAGQRPANGAAGASGAAGGPGAAGAVGAASGSGAAVAGAAGADVTTGADAAGAPGASGAARAAAGTSHDGQPACASDMALLTSLGRDQPVTFDVDGDALSAAPPEVAGAVYRIVRESLTNARKHTAGAPVHVRVAIEAEVLTVVVVNAPSRRRSAPGSGHGIPGMRRRARAVGGRLAAGPTRDGGFHVTARLPR